MDWEIEYLQQERVVLVRNSGRLTDIHQNLSMISEGLAEAAKHGATKFMLDNRDLILEMKSVDIYYLPKEFDKLGVSNEYKVAIIVSAASIENKNFKFYENRAANLGYRHRLFTDPDAALGWLTEPD